MAKSSLSLSHLLPHFPESNLSNHSEPQQVPPCVLVVDNRPADTLIMSHYLRQFGCHHHIAATCEAAAAHIEGHSPYDAIFVDLATLGADKNGLLPLIRGRGQRSEKRRTQIIAMSASAFEDTRNAAGFGFDGYLTKPCNPRLLAQKLGVRDEDSPVR